MGKFPPILVLLGLLSMSLAENVNLYREVERDEQKIYDDYLKHQDQLIDNWDQCQRSMSTRVQIRILNGCIGVITEICGGHQQCIDKNYELCHRYMDE